MTFPYAVGHPDYSPAGTTNRFIPEVWAGKMIVKYYANTFLSQITNTDYEGEIKKQGDTVIMRSIPDITIEDHNIGDKVTYERPESPPTTLLIDKGKRWGIRVDDIVKVQSDLPLLNKWTDDASMQMKISIERSFLRDSAIYAGMSADNTGTTCGVISNDIDMGTTGAPKQVTKANVLDFIIDAGTILEENDVPVVNPWFIMPTWMAGTIKKSDLKDASLTGDGRSTLRTGQIGMIDKFTLFSSNLLYTAGSPAYWVALYGTRDAITFATQLTKTESMRSQDSFDDLVRGLQVYGYKVVKNVAYGALIAKK